MSQSGLGLPSRDYYLRAEASFAGAQDKYRNYIEAMLSLAGPLTGVIEPASAMSRLEFLIGDSNE